MSLSALEVERGWVEHVCPTHGVLVATTPRAVVNCRCGKVARIMRSGRVVSEKLRPTSAKAHELNKIGQPYAHGCGDCGEDFHGASLLKRHRSGRGASKRCLTSTEMVGKRWARDSRGRWRNRRNVEQLRDLRGLA